MKFKLSIWLIGCFLSITAMGSFANEQCSTIQFSNQRFNDTQFVIEPIVHNDQMITENFSTKSIIKGNLTLQLSPGWHTFFVKVWDVHYLKSLQPFRQDYKRHKQYYQPVVNYINVHVTQGKYKVQMNTEALFHPKKKETDDKASLFSLTKQSDQCANDVTETQYQAEPKVVATTTLPMPFQYRLQKLFAKASSENLENKDTVRIVAPMKQMDAGFILDKKSLAHDKLLIVAISPNTFASELGLHSGDTIIGVNNVRFKKQNVATFNRYLLTIQSGSEVNLLVQRNGINFQLSKQFNGRLIPEARVLIANKSSVADQIITMPLVKDERQLKLEYLLEQIEQYLQSTGIAKTQLNIHMPQQYDSVFGMALEKVKSSLTVSFVQPRSPAKSLGLLAGDIIKRINGVAINDLSDINRQIKGLTVNKAYSITVQRNQAEKTLSAQYQPELLPEIMLTLNRGAESDYLALSSSQQVKQRHPCLFDCAKYRKRNIDDFNHTQNAKLRKDTENGTISSQKTPVYTNRDN